MSTLDDKILGEKLHYYCSSSEDEEEADDIAPEGTGAICTRPGATANTGPKGVIEDWRRYKQLECEKRAEQKAELVTLAEKLSMTCRTDREDKDAKAAEDKLDRELEEMLDDDFMQNYVKKRMEEMAAFSAASKRTFQGVMTLKDEDDFLAAVDQESKDVVVLIFVYETRSKGCDAVNACLINLAKAYPNVKFCRTKATAVGLSSHFKASGVPAILAYRGGDIFASLIRITDSLGDDLLADDLESFLIENDVLTDKPLVATSIRGPSIDHDDSD